MLPPAGACAGAGPALTAHVDFEALAPTCSASAYALRQQLTVARSQATNETDTPTHNTPCAPLNRRVRWAECYLSLLHRLTDEEPEAAAALAASHPGAFQWRSPCLSLLLTSAAAHELQQLCSVAQERVLATHLYAALLQAQASQLLYGSAPGAAVEPNNPLVSTASTSSQAGAKHGGKAGKPRPLQRLKSLFSFRARRGGGGGAPGCGASHPGSNACADGSQPASSAPSFSSSCSGAWTPRRSSCTGSPRVGGAADQGPGADADAAQGAQEFAHAAALYRRAAGVYQHIASALLPAVGPGPEAAARLADEAAVEEGAAEGAVPTLPELRPGFAEALARMCLAQAQAVAAYRCATRGSSPALAAALHRGAADLFSAAQDQADLKHCLPGQLRRLLGTSARWHQAEAWRQAALHQQALGQGGAAVACMQRALHEGGAAFAKHETGDVPWHGDLAAERAGWERQLAVMDRERSVVYFQQVAAVPPGLPPPRVIVTEAIPFELPAPEVACEGLL